MLTLSVCLRNVPISCWDRARRAKPLIRHSLKEARTYDLLDTSVYLALSQNPGRIAEELGPKDKVVVIDEVQRIPELLNEVHRLIVETVKLIPNAELAVIPSLQPQIKKGKEKSL